MKKNDIYNSLYGLLIVIASLIFALNIQFNSSFKSARFETILYNLINMKSLNMTYNSFMAPIYQVFTSFVIILFVALIPLILGTCLKKEVFIKVKKKKRKIFPFSLKLYGLILVSLSVVSILCSVNFFGFLFNNLQHSSLYEDYYVEYKKDNIVFPDEKSNLITIYVESFENSAFSLKSGGTNKESYMPKMEEITNKYINFSNNEKIGGFYQVNGTDWTASSLVAQTSGVPIYFKTKNSNNKFLEGVVSIGEVLEDNGYENYFLMGSDSGFADRDRYFSEHGSYRISDYFSSINDRLIPADYYEWWGYEDRKLYEFAKNKLLQVSKSEEPFNFSILTADTHCYDGYTDDKCPKKFASNYANSYYCTDTMLYDFINWIQEQEFYEDTVVVIVGDHLTMRDDFFNTYDNYERTVYNLFINSRVNTNKTKNRYFSAFDMYPTTLAALGVKIENERLALGTNLFSDQKTLIEEIGLDKFQKEISKVSKYYDEKILKK